MNAENIDKKKINLSVDPMPSIYFGQCYQCKSVMNAFLSKAIRHSAYKIIACVTQL